MHCTTGKRHEWEQNTDIENNKRYGRTHSFSIWCHKSTYTISMPFRPHTIDVQPHFCILLLTSCHLGKLLLKLCTLHGTYNKTALISQILSVIESSNFKTAAVSSGGLRILSEHVIIPHAQYLGRMALLRIVKKTLRGGCYAVPSWGEEWAHFSSRCALCRESLAHPLVYIM